MEEKDQGLVSVPFFAHENDMMHKDVDNERMHTTYRKTIRDICITFVIIIVIFVTAYTVRTSVWLKTIDKMNDAIIEMAELHHNCGSEVDHAENTSAP